MNISESGGMTDRICDFRSIQKTKKSLKSKFFFERNKYYAAEGYFLGKF